jgi:hypothetical protein
MVDTSEFCLGSYHYKLESGSRDLIALLGSGWKYLKCRMLNGILLNSKMQDGRLRKDRFKNLFL